MKKAYNTTKGQAFDVDSKVINDAENILCVYETEGRIDVSKTYVCDIKIRKAVDMEDGNIAGAFIVNHIQGEG